MGGLTDKKLAKIQAKMERFMPETAKFYSIKNVSDGRGAVIRGKRTLEITTKCRVASMNVQEEVIWQDKLTNPQGFILHTPANSVDIDKGVTYEVWVFKNATDIEPRLKLDVDDVIADQTWEIQTKLVCSKGPNDARDAVGASGTIYGRDPDIRRP